MNRQPAIKIIPHSIKMCELWDDLEEWSLQDKKSEWGEFRTDIYGSHFHVGIIYYQVVLTKRDEEKITSDIFKKKDGTVTPIQQIQRLLILLKPIAHYWKQKTQRRIKK